MTATKSLVDFYLLNFFNIFYATKESLERFDRAADRVSEKYGYKKYLAAAFILEELLTRFTDE